MGNKINAACSSRHPTFRDIVETTREIAAESAWQRAQLASRLRHTYVNRGLYRQARQLSVIKQEAIFRAWSILPHQIQITVDNDWRRGYISFQWPNHGGLHLPPSSAATQAHIKRSCTAFNLKLCGKYPTDQTVNRKSFQREAKIAHADRKGKPTSFSTSARRAPADGFNL